MTNTKSVTWLKIKHVAEILNVHPATIRRQAKRKNIPIGRVGGAYRIREDHLSLLMTVEVPRESPDLTLVLRSFAPRD